MRLQLWRIVTVIASIALVGACRSGNESVDIQPSAALQEIADRAVKDGFPGVVIAASDPNGRIFAAAAGAANRAEGTAMTPRSKVHAASTTKAVTAAAVLMLVDRGELSLEATLLQLLPADVVGLIPYAGRITVRDLLLHTSGIYSPNNNRDYLARYIGPERLERPFWTAKEIVAFAADPNNAPLFEPGEGQAYGDINYVLLSMIVAETSNRPFKQFVQNEIFSPLGMANTYFLSDDPHTPRVRAYTLDSNVIRTIGLDPALAPDKRGLIDTTGAQEQSDGAAGIITTMPDLIRFADAFVRGELLSAGSRSFVLDVASNIDGAGKALGVLRAYHKPYGVIVTAEGDGPGTNVVWAMNMETSRIAAISVNLFGRFDESDYMIGEMLPAVFNAYLGERR